MFNNETLRALSLEILKSKCDLKNSSEEEILKFYLDIYASLQNANKTLKSDDNIKILK
ncbi:conserved protein of unknown function [Tepidanaerobacter acetatoxydans Re1]|uniref:Uncharacterized protein n=1 Tax=Tepidanaerobacter acetatoxydans (strain DSM 21804 / JCM 16047 / Re1) TaxID=1209989 RepID=F4LRV4_TEPAE|nr:hypothetical protein [Tepidanaerobacter acetatoxydans]AEE91172.1 hypothetical protein TepRe1_1024 [Tepidanaerobacter acetatoxydans Re1]CCP25843.1 conserved protein of unknown function [Tepidanaerobacter acetatoxydans Re1]